jgi:hypothetical protein
MEKNTIKVLKGYSELSYLERREVRDFIEKYDKEEFDKRKILIKSLTESLGPLDTNTCPCCGK